MKKILLTGVVFLLATYSLPSMATCSALNGWSGKTISFNFPATIPVQRDLPVGGTISSISTPLVAGSQEYLSCTGVSTLLNSGYLNGWVPPVTGITPTNVPGVGIRITLVNQATPRVVPFELATIGGTYSLINANWTVELIKTGPVSAGQIALGRYAGFAVKSAYWITYIEAGSGGQIVPVSCSVSNTAISVPLGEVNVSQFIGPGSTPKTYNFNVALDCDAGTKVNITLDGTHDSSGIPGVLALSPSAGTVAQGAGVQLLHGGTPVALGVPIATGTAATAGNYNIPLVAQYYQTADTVRPGVANSAATFTMTYN